MTKFSDNSMASIVWEGVNIAPGTLAEDSFKSTASKIDASRLQGFRVLKTEYFGAVNGMTTGEGPLVLVLAHDMSQVEMKECFDANPQRSNDLAASEQARRPMWPLEILQANSDGDGKAFFQGVAKIGWSIPEGTDLFWAVVNLGAALTTGATVRILAKHFGVWLKD